MLHCDKNPGSGIAALGDFCQSNRMEHVSDYGWVDQAPESSSYLDPAVLTLVKKYGGGEVLDAGCGNGQMAHFLHSQGIVVSGFDADPTGIEIARRNYPAIPFTVGTFNTPPPRQYPLVVSTEVVEHLYSPHEFAAFCFTTLEPGGHAIVSTPYHGYLKNVAVAAAGKWDHHHNPGWHGGHVKFWSRETLSKLLADAGLNVVEFVGVGRLPFLWKSMILVAQKPA